MPRLQSLPTSRERGRKRDGGRGEGGNDTKTRKHDSAELENNSAELESNSAELESNSVELKRNSVELPAHSVEWEKFRGIGK